MHNVNVVEEKFLRNMVNVSNVHCIHKVMMMVQRNGIKPLLAIQTAVLQLRSKMKMVLVQNVLRSRSLSQSQILMKVMEPNTEGSASIAVATRDKW